MPRQWTKWEKAEMFLFAGPVTILFGLTILAMMLGVFVTLFWHPHPSRENYRRASCQSNLKQIALIALHYLEDYEAYPLTTNPANSSWRKLYPSITTDSEIFQCPTDSNATGVGKNSYGYNANLSGRRKEEVKSSVSTIVNFEVTARTDNRTQTGTTLAAVTAAERHLSGANYSFADGHVKWLKPNRISGAKPNGKNFTFAVK
jgi:prepilin-type processing-associated H-X9-DG protein